MVVWQNEDFDQGIIKMFVVSHLNMRDVTHCYVTLPEPEGKYVFVAKKTSGRRVLAKW